MRKNLPYILGGFLLVALTILVISSAGKAGKRKMDERITLRQKDKIPYGYYAMHHLLPALFPQAEMTEYSLSPDGWDDSDYDGSGQLMILPTRNFFPSSTETKEILRFMERGNHVFIITGNMGSTAEDALRIKFYPEYLQSISGNDSLVIQLDTPVHQKQVFMYPGRRIASMMRLMDSSRQMVLGSYTSGGVHFIRMRSGSGSLYIHSEPLAFSNYFILHKNNIRYLEQVFSHIPANIRAIHWNEHYLDVQPKPKQPGWLRVLWRYEAFRWAFLTALGTLLLAGLLEWRRRQRFIPERPVLKNESLDFVETLGRLYYDQKDHAGLSRKMTQYFLDHVRTKYKLPTEDLGPEFVTALHHKSGYPEKDLRSLTGYASLSQDGAAITEQQLGRYYQQLESFYQNT